MRVEYDGKTMSARELAAKLEATGRPKCRVCGYDIKSSDVLCPSCDQGYEACRADVVAFIGQAKDLAKKQNNVEAVSALSVLLYFVERGDADGFRVKVATPEGASSYRKC